MNTNYFIKIEILPECSQIEDAQISGAFSIPNTELSVNVKNSDVLKHIILVITRSDNYQSVTPFSDAVVFDDDVSLQADVVVGSFKIKLNDHIRFYGDGDFYILCSLGVNTSNIIKLTI